MQQFRHYEISCSSKTQKGWLYAKFLHLSSLYNVARIVLRFLKIFLLAQTL
jgi:hypothetical protein